MSGFDQETLRALDREARKTVRTRFDGPIVLEAGAGTGKTTTLVARVIAWLIDRGFDEARRELGSEVEAERVAARALDGVLAITFTEAAAADMDAKLRAALCCVEKGDLPKGMEEHRFGCSEGERLQRATLLRRALDRPLARTIHGFCRNLLSDHALLAGLHPDFEVDIEGRTVRELVRAAVAQDLTARLKAGTDADWFTLAQRKIGPLLVEDALVRLVLGGHRALDLAAESFSPGVLSNLTRDLYVSINAFLTRCEAPLRTAGGRTPLCGELVDVLAEIRESLQVASDDPAVVFERAQFIKQKLRKGLREKLDDWACGKFGKAMDAIETDHPVLREQSADLQPRINAYMRLDPVLESAGRRVLSRILLAVRQALVRRGVESAGDLLRDARDLLQGRPALCVRLRAGLKQVLVDEFQDTDPLQCEIVVALSLDPAHGRRPGLLIVGDPKQSIYGFRSADLRAYEKFVADAVAAGGAKFELSVNYRSKPEILARVAQVIEPVMIAEPGVQPPFQPLVAHHTEAGGILEHWHVASPDMHVNGRGRAGAAEARIEAQFLATELIAAGARGVDWRDIGILMRTSSGLDILLEALRSAGVPFDVVGDKNYYRRREVQDTAALITCIVDPTDHIALVACLRSPLVGVPDALWIPLWNQRFPEVAGEIDARRPETLLAARAVVARALKLMPRDVPHLDRIAGFEHALDHALESLAQLRKSFRTEATDTFLERLRLLFLPEATAAARFQGLYRVANLARFFHEVGVELEHNGGDTQRLLRFLREAIADAQDAAEAKPRDTSASAVQIQTIHKSKGLDYREVFVIGLHRTTNRTQTSRETTAIEGSARVLFGAPNPAWLLAEAHNQRREAAETVRLLYVAMTRAKQRLVLSGSLPKKPAVTSLNDNPPPHMLALLEGSISEGRAYLEGDLSRDETERTIGLVRYKRVTAAAETRNAAAPDVDLARWVERARRDTARLRDLRRSAALRQAEPTERRMSAVLPALTTDPEHAAAARPAPTAASLAGTAVHAALEDLRLENVRSTAELEAEADRLRATLAERVAVAAGGRVDVAAAVRSAAVERAQVVFDTLRASALWVRLAQIAPHVVARELPLLSRSNGAGGAVCTATGSVDLVYRDPESGEIVVVDYKTDAVTDATGARRNAAHHRPQIDAYRTTLQGALNLPRAPRAELWFLAAGEVVVIDANPAVRNP
ncbi:MAG: UvrD-helicase domain-containing protein [Planctomycetes bacterium]|nr:UvrD-helicase domain-containing protein [Planctomycetota bacterium]